MTKSPFTNKSLSSVGSNSKKHWKNGNFVKKFLKESEQQAERKYISFEVLTEKVRSIAVKADLDNIARNALSEMATSLIEMTAEIIGELIKISRQNRGMMGISTGPPNRA